MSGVNPLRAEPLGRPDAGVDLLIYDMDSGMGDSWKNALTPWQLLESAIRDKPELDGVQPGDLALAAEALAKGADVNHREGG